MQTPQPWFNDRQATNTVQRQERHPWPKERKPGPNTGDILETLDFLWRHPGTSEFLLLIPFVIGTATTAGSIVAERVDSLPVMITIGFLLQLVSMSFVIGLMLPIRNVLLGEQVSLKDGVKSVLPNLPSVAITTIVASTIFLIGFAACFVPGFIVLPFVVRAPYEAACGASPLTAFKNAFNASRLSFTFGAGGANVVLELLVGNVLISTTASELSIVSPNASLAFHTIASTLLTSIVLISLVGVYLTGDATMSGGLNSANLEAHRKPTRSIYRRIVLSGPYRILRSMLPFITIIFLAFGFSEAPGFMDAFGGGTEQLPPVGQVAPTFSLENVDGTTFTSTALEGKPTAVYAWAPWCAPCAGQVKALHTLMDENPDKYNIVSVALSYDERGEVTQYIEDKSVQYPVLYGDDSFWPNNPIGAYPTVVTLDSDGVVTGRWTGVTSARTLKTTMDGTEL